jgi:hypothetical protein
MTSNLTGFSSETTASRQFELSPRHTTGEAQTGMASPAASYPSILGTKDGDSPLVVVSKTPELFTYVLAGLSLLVTVITLVLAGSSYIGIKFAAEARKQVAEVKKLTQDYTSKVEALEKEISQFYVQKKKDLEAHARQVFTAIAKKEYELFQVKRQKQELRNELAQQRPDFMMCYRLLTQVLQYPDSNSLGLYARCLQVFPDKPDIARAVRRGLQLYDEDISSVL